MEGSENRRQGVLPVRPWFRTVWAGYERKSVDRHLRAVEDELELLTSERDHAARLSEKLATELESLRAAHEELKQRFDRVCRTPIDADGLSERLLRMVELAHVEADEIVGNATTRAERTRTAADEDARRLRGRHERKQHELDRRRTTLEQEYAELTRRRTTEFDEADREAEQQRRRLDEESARRRQQAERDMARALAARREEATAAIARREEEANARAAELVTRAEQRAGRMVDEATARVRRLDDTRRALSTQLRTAREVLATTSSLVEPVSGESEAAPQPTGGAGGTHGADGPARRYSALGAADEERGEHAPVSRPAGSTVLPDHVAVRIVAADAAAAPGRAGVPSSPVAAGEVVPEQRADEAESVPVPAEEGPRTPTVTIVAAPVLSGEPNAVEHGV